MATGLFAFTTQIARAQMVDLHTGALAAGPNQPWYVNFQNLATQLATLQAVANNAFGTNVFLLANQPSLGVSDAGYVGFVSDYAHLVFWTGTAWILLDGVGGYFAPFMVTPSIGWAACDGSVAKILQPGATLTTTSATTPNLNGSAAYVKSAASYTSTIAAASGTTATGTTGTGTTGTGLTGSSTTAPSSTGTGTTGTGTTGTTTQPGAGVQTGSSFNVWSATNANAHTHSVPGLSIPALTIPSLTTNPASIPGLAVPGLAIPGLGVGTLDMAHVGAPFYVRL